MTTQEVRGGAVLLIALTFLNILNFGDRYLLIAFSNAIVKELGLTHLQFGLLTGIVFTGIYTIFGLFTGSLADRVHRPRLIAAGLTLWSGLTAVTGLTRGFGQMAAARLFIGIGEACLTPTALSLLAERFAPARRAFASGFYYMGFPVGIGLSFIFAGYVGPTLGWRGGFIALGALGLVASLLIILFMRDPQRAAARAPGTTHSFADTFRGIGAELLTNRALVLTLLGSGLAVFSIGAGILDLLWWVRERGYTAPEAGTTLGNLFLYGGAVGAIIGGSGSDWAHRRWTAGRLKFLAAAYLVSAPLVMAYRLVPGHTPLFLFLGFYVSAVTLLLFGPALSAIQDVMPPKHRGASVSLFVLVTSLFGAGGGNATAGWLADLYTQAGAAEPLTSALLVMQIPGALSIPVFYLAARALAKRGSESSS